MSVSAELVRVEDGEAHAVEADQAFFGRQPDVAIGGLRDRADRGLWQAVAGSPVVGGVLGDERARIERRRRDRRGQQRGRPPGLRAASTAAAGPIERRRRCWRRR